MRILIICGALLLFLLGGLALWWFGIKGGSVPTIEEVTSSFEQTNERPVIDFVELEPLTFPVIRDGTVYQLVTYAVRLEVERGDKETVEKRLPAIRNALLSELHKLYAFRFVHEGQNKMQFVKPRLREAAESATRVPVDRVLLEAIDHRPQ